MKLDRTQISAYYNQVIIYANQLNIARIFY